VKYLTTSEAAKALGLSPRTVSRLFEAGHLRGYKIPQIGSRPGSRRITLESVEELQARTGST